ncbi:MAG TPA: hypothetical protein VF094_10495 [Gaiellaceae bacterium]
MRRFTVVALLAAGVLGGCGKTTPHYTLAKTSACLQQAGASLGGQLDFVATTATGGATHARLRDNSLTLVFGQSQGDADNIDAAYRRFRSSNVGIDDVLRQQGNAVMLWHEHPNDADLATVTGCLK